MILRHVHFRGVIPYAVAASFQSQMVAAFLAHKASPIHTPMPEPTVITANFHPVYTCGRREVGSVSLEQQSFLTQPTDRGSAEFHEALRGGQTTFHGPGQLIAYPVLDLKRHSLTPRSYVCLLEKSVIKLLQLSYHVKAMTTDNPGVWTDEDHKICALGVHLRRNVTSHGIGLNSTTDLAWFERIVACGLEGKKTTSLEEQGVRDGLSVEVVANGFVQVLAEGLGIDDIRKDSKEMSND